MFPNLSEELTYALSMFNCDPRPLDKLILAGKVDHWEQNELAYLFRMLRANSRLEAASYVASLGSFVIDMNDFHTYPSERRSLDSEGAFLEYCERSGITIIRRLQKAQYGSHQKSWVYLVQDTDGLYKVFKEELDYTRRPVTVPREAEIMERLKGVKGVSQYLGTVTYDDHRFTRMEMIYGQTMTWMTRNCMLPATARHMIRSLARTLLAILERGVLFLDLKPENILLTDDGPVILDFGVAALETDPYVDIFLCDPRYVTPEGVIYRQASRDSLVYQLGVMYFQMLFAQHPAGHSGDLYPHFEANITNYAIPNATQDYTIPPELDGLPLISDCERLLARNPSDRPTLEEIAEWDIALPDPQPFATNPPPSLKSVLFPARMGIPHRGHIEYMNRIMHCGYRLIISLQKSYTLSNRDPLPKWIVADLVTNALRLRGWIEGMHYRVIYTPFYETDQQHQMHFLMLPEFERGELIGVASGNPEVHKLFTYTDLPMLNQHSFFACETGVEAYEVRSWGEHLRAAVKDNDRAAFEHYAVPGHESVLTLEETQGMYHEQDIEFVPGTVYVTLIEGDKTLIPPVRVKKYAGPRAALCAKLGEARTSDLVYHSMVFDGTDLHIRFERKVKERVENLS